MIKLKIIATAAVLAGLLPIGFATAMDDHVVVQADGLKWGPIPPGFPPGAQVAVVSGDPTSNGFYVVRAKMPAGYRVAPHTHPTDENVTVLSGAFGVGMGEKIEQEKGTTLKAGGFFRAAKGMAHYAWASEETVIQIHGQGPLAITYVNPADDPRNKK